MEECYARYRDELPEDISLPELIDALRSGIFLEEMIAEGRCRLSHATPAEAALLQAALATAEDRRRPLLPAEGDSQAT